eukprot:RCo023583
MESKSPEQRGGLSIYLEELGVAPVPVTPADDENSGSPSSSTPGLPAEDVLPLLRGNISSPPARLQQYFRSAALSSASAVTQEEQTAEEISSARVLNRARLQLSNLSLLKNSLVHLVRVILLDSNVNPGRCSLPVTYVYHMAQIFNPYLLQRLHISFAEMLSFLMEFNNHFNVGLTEFEAGYCVSLWDPLPTAQRVSGNHLKKLWTLQCLRDVVNAVGYITVDGFMDLLKENP